MGGPESEAKYEAFIEAFAEYLTGSLRPSSTNDSDIQQYLEEVLDEEFSTVVDDGSTYELGQLFVRYILLILQDRLNEVEEELQLQQSTVASIQMSVRNEDDDSSSSESDDDMTEEAEKPKKQSMEVDEDGWTTVHRRK